MIQSSEVIQQLETMLVTFRRELLRAHGDLSQQLRSANDHLASLHQLLQSGSTSNRTDSDTAPVTFSNVERDVAADDKHVAELEKTISDLKTEIAQLRSQEAWIVAANQDLSERIVALRNEEKSNLTALAACNEEIKHMRESLDEAERRIAQFSQITVDIEDLRNANASLHYALETAEAQLSSLERRQRIIINALAEDGAARKLGEILVVAGIVTQEQLDEALREQQKRTHALLGEILVERGRADEEDVAQTIACQMQLPLIRLHKNAWDTEAAAALGKQACATHKFVPLKTRGSRLVLAMADPKNQAATEHVRQKTGRGVSPVVAVPSEVASAIEDIFCA